MDGAELMKREGGRHSLRIQVEGLKQQVAEMNKDLDDKTVLMQETEASLRSEVRLIIPGNNDGKPAGTTTCTNALLASAATARQTVKHTNSVTSGRKPAVSRSLTKIEIGENCSSSTSASPAAPVTSSSVTAAPEEKTAAAEVKTEESAPAPPNDPSPLVRYKSLRDQEGKFSLVVKIR